MWNSKWEKGQGEVEGGWEVGDEENTVSDQMQVGAFEAW